MTQSHLKFIVIGLMALGLMASCKKNNGGTADGVGFKAMTEQEGSSGKTYGVSDGNSITVNWTAYDRIKVRNNLGTELTYELTQGEGSPNGIFYTGENHEGFFQPNYVAAYPANRVSAMTASSVTFDLPATQVYNADHANSFGEGAAPMVAHSKNQTLKFKNVLGGLCFMLTDAVSASANNNVAKIELVSRINEGLCGPCTATFTVDGDENINDITTSPATGGNTVTLKCNPAITLSSDAANPTKFYIMLPPGTLESGFTLRVYNADSVQIYESTRKPRPEDNPDDLVDLIQRNRVVRMNSNLEIVGSTLSVTTTSPSRINYDYARGNGTVDVAPASCGFVYVLQSEITDPDNIDKELILNSSNSNVKTAVSETSGTSFYAELTDLSDDSFYWVRAWAKNGTGAVTYGSHVELETRKDYSKAPNFGLLDGVFSADKPTEATIHKVRFSMGNLQYNNDSGKWRYATQQYDYVGHTQDYGTVYLADGTKCDNKSVVNADGSRNTSYKGWIDLFAWGTSGNDHGAEEYEPWIRYSSNNINGKNYAREDFRAYGNTGGHLYQSNGQADWGYNPIINGSAATGIEYKCTPNNHNFHTLLQWRGNCSTINGTANARFAFAKLSVTDTMNHVITVRGIMLFPDEITWPTGVPYPTHINDTPARDVTNAQGVTTHYEPGYYGPLDGEWDPTPNFTTYTEAQWIKLEKAGVVFLPSAGCWGNGGMSWYNNRGGRYWTSVNDHNGTEQKYQIGISPAQAIGDGGPACAAQRTWGFYGFSVRLWYIYIP